MNRFIPILAGVCCLFTISGCLKTRADLRDGEAEQTLQKQTVSQEQGRIKEIEKPAPTTPASRFEEIDEQMRQLNGRVDELENALSQIKSGQQGNKEAETKEKQALEQRFGAYEEELKKLASQIAAQNDEIAKLKTATATPPPAPVGASGPKGKNAYEEGEQLFTAKKWKEAIVAFQKYRDGNPKGKAYADSTYKIGVAFQELGMKDEAKVFYEEVAAKYPSSKEAKKAAIRLKSIR